MTGFSIRPLSEATWDDFADLVERHNGVWGGCWCLHFHAEGAPRKLSTAERKSVKHDRVRAGTTQSALVYDGPACVGRCQFGQTAELPRIRNRKAYEQGLVSLPDWRITCFFVDKAHRGRGVADAALAGAVAEIARLGGGSVEGYPDDVENRKTSASFLHAGTVPMFERNGFVRVRPLGKTQWVMTRTIAGAGAVSRGAG